MSKVSAIIVLLSFLSVATGFTLAPQTRTPQLLKSQQQLSMGMDNGKKTLTVSEEFGVPKPPNSRYVYPKMPDTGKRQPFQQRPGNTAKISYTTNKNKYS